jgi:pyruvate formate lyase activating enzyme
MYAKVHSIESFGTVDGPGVRFVVFMQGCPLRCQYCHNPDTWDVDGGKLYSPEELMWLFRKNKPFYSKGGITVTGGEPLLHAEIEGFISEVKSLGYSVKLDTNGFFPEKLISLVNKGLVDYVAVDFKSTYEKYSLATGIESVDTTPFKKTVEFLLSDAVDYEFRTTVVKGIHETQDIVEIAKTISGAKRYFLQSFVDSGDLISSGFCAFSPENMKKARDLASAFVTNTEIRGI